MLQSASHMYTSADTTNSRLANATIAPLTSFASSGTAFDGPTRDQILGLFQTCRSGTGRQRDDNVTADATRLPSRQLAPWYRQSATFSSVAIILASTGGLVAGDPAFRKELLAERQEDQAPEASSQQRRIKMVEVMGAETSAFAGFGDHQFGENGTA